MSTLEEKALQEANEVPAKTSRSGKTRNANLNGVNEDESDEPGLQGEDATANGGAAETEVAEEARKKAEAAKRKEKKARNTARMAQALELQKQLLEIAEAGDASEQEDSDSERYGFFEDNDELVGSGTVNVVCLANSRTRDTLAVSSGAMATQRNNNAKVSSCANSGQGSGLAPRVSVFGNASHSNPALGQGNLGRSELVGMRQSNSMRGLGVEAVDYIPHPLQRSDSYSRATAQLCANSNLNRNAVDQRSDETSSAMERKIAALERQIEALNAHSTSASPREARRTREFSKQLKSVIETTIKFSGKMDDEHLKWKVWLEVFETNCDTYEVSEEDRCTLMTSMLTGIALAKFLEIPVQERRDWEKVVEAMDMNFAERSTKAQENRRLFALYKGKDQSVHEWQAMFMSAVCKAFPGLKRTKEVEQWMAGVWITRMIFDPELQTEIWKREPEGWDNTVQAALDAEGYLSFQKANAQASGGAGGGGNYRRNRGGKGGRGGKNGGKSSEDGKSDNTQKDGKIEHKGGGNANAVKQQQSSSGCYIGGDPEHFKRNCPKNPEAKKEGQRFHALQELEKSIEEREAHLTKEQRGFNEICRRMGQEPAYYGLLGSDEPKPKYKAVVEAGLGGNAKTALMDTGADVSLIKASSVPNIMGFAQAETKTDRDVVTTQCGQVKIMGKLKRVPIELGKQKYVLSCYIVEDLAYDLVVGDNFYCENDVEEFTANFKKGFIRLDRGTPIRMLKKVRVNEVNNYSVNLLKNMSLEPKQSVKVCASVQLGYRPGEDYHFSGKALEKQKGAEVLDALVRPEEMRMPVWLKNNSDKRVEFYEGQAVGEITQIEPDEIIAELSIDDLLQGWNPETAEVLNPAFCAEAGETSPGGGESVNALSEEQASEVMTSEQIVEFLLQDAKKTLTASQFKRAKALLEKYSDIFVTSSFQLGAAKVPPFDIDTGDATPIRQQAYRIPEAKKEIVSKLIDEMLEAGAIEPSCSAWASPICLVKKKDGKERFCQDMRRVNAVTKLSAYPLNRIDDLIDRIGDSKIFSSFDLASGYWRVPLTERAKEKTAFITFRGLYQCRCLPFGVANGPSHFSAIMNDLLPENEFRNLLVYLDDILGHSRNFDNHLEHLEELFIVLRRVKLKVKTKKVKLFQTELPFLGFIITKDGVKPDPEKVSAIRDYPPLRNVKEVQAFMGLVNYYARFCSHLSSLASPLFALLRKEVKFTWGQEQQAAMEAIKSCFEDEILLQDAALTPLRE